LVDRINNEEDLYRILGVARKAKTEEIRRAFLGRSRLCHPE
jgi:curved DNA-binding protein CbpA